MKRVLNITVFVCIIAACSFLSYNYGYKQGKLSSIAPSNPSINRAPYVIYPETQYEWEKDPVFIYWATNDTRYHESPVCSFAEKIRDGFIKVSVFEAAERGYMPCAGCIVDEVRLAP